MRNRKTGVRSGAVSALLAATVLGAATARADDQREKELENRVQDLEKRLAEVSESLRGGYFTANSDLEARITELERSASDDKNGMAWVFKNGMKAESGDKAFAWSIFGRVQNDWVFWDAPREVESALGDDLNGGTNFRRVRLGVGGTMYGNVKFKSEMDFANSSVEFADVYMELTNCSFGTVRVGHFDEPFSIDRLTSSRFSTFIERNLVETFAPARNTGIMLFGNAAEDRMTYQVGMFRDSDARGADTGNDKAGEYNLTARLAGRPIVEDDGTTYLHLGIAGSYRDYSNDEVTFGARPLVRVGTPNFVEQKLTDISDGHLIGLEAAYVAGPLTFKAEYAMAHGNGRDNTAVEDYDFSALSLEASYWLTGETTPYDKSAARFDRPKVKTNYGDGEGSGAWQLALGYDTIDLTDGPYDASTTGNAKNADMDVWRVGVNWYMNPNTRISMNVIRADQEEFEDEAMALVLRFQVDF